MSISFASFFSGIGGFDVGFERAGMKCVFQCELDDSCRALLGRKFSALVLADILAIAAAHRRIRKNKPFIDHEKWNRLFELLRSAAVWCGGFPCQDVSVAGLRAGLAGERSGLWFAFRRLLALFRPAWVVVENVPGLLSSHGGRDFAAIVSGLEKLGYRWAYRTIDAQYLGVAQRRERVFIVASLGDYRCAEVLFERESVCGNPAPSRSPEERVARPIAACPAGGSGYRNDADTADNLIPETVGALSDGAHNGGGSTVRTHILDESLPAVARCLNSRSTQRIDWETETLLPMRRGGFFDEAIAFDTTQITSPDNRCNPQPGDPCHPLSAHAHAPAIAFSGRNRGAEPAVGREERAPHSMVEMVGALDATKPWNVATSKAVRRLTPTECERLQGFPDGWTLGFSDSVRYRMLGNAVCVNVAEWIGKRIVSINRIRPEDATLLGLEN